MSTQTKDITPKGEPVIWSTVVALALGALASYGLGVTDELRELLIYLVPIIAGAIWARNRVTPVARVDQAVQKAYTEGLAEYRPAPTRTGDTARRA